MQTSAFAPLSDPGAAVQGAAAAAWDANGVDAASLPDELAAALRGVAECTGRLKAAIEASDVEGAAKASIARANALGALEVEHWPNASLPVLGRYLFGLLEETRALTDAVSALRESTRSELRSNKNSTRLIRAYGA